MDQLKSALPEGLRIGKIHHVAIIVRDLEAVLDLYRDKLGLTVETVMSIPYDRVTIGFLPVGEVKIELVQPDDRHVGVLGVVRLHDEGRRLHHHVDRLHHHAVGEVGPVELVGRLGRRVARVGAHQPRTIHPTIVRPGVGRCHTRTLVRSRPVAKRPTRSGRVG